MYGSDIFPYVVTPIMLTGKKLCSFVPKSLAKIVPLGKRLQFKILGEKRVKRVGFLKMFVSNGGL